MDKTYKTIGIVLRRQDWRESDSLFSLYTRDFGKLKALAIGSKKIKSKLMGHLSAWGIVDLMLARSKTIDRLAGASLKEKFNLSLETDFYYINLIFELLDKALHESQKDLAVWNLVLDAITGLESAENNDQRKIICVYFIVSLFKLLGYQSELFHCAVCHKIEFDKIYFDLRSNGLVCQKCLVDNRISVSQELVKFLRLLNNQDSQTLEHLVIKKSLLEELWSFLQAWVPYVLEQEINSLKIFD